jgi:hypothetical protein
LDQLQDFLQKTIELVGLIRGSFRILFNQIKDMEY